MEKRGIWALSGNTNGLATKENSMKVPHKIKDKTTTWSTNRTSGYLSQVTKITILKRYLHTCVQCSTVYNGQDTETTRESTSGWTGKKVTRTHTECHSAINRKPCSLWSKSETNTVWFHLHVKSKKAELVKTEQIGGCQTLLRLKFK